MAKKKTGEEATESVGQYWHGQLEGAQKVFDKWETRAKKVVKRYRDERDAVESQRKKFNILWSNIQILQPSLYGRAAHPEVSRRYLDQDPVGRLASTLLERALEYEVEQFPDFDAAMRGCVEDRLLPGRGVAWIRYDPTIVTEEAPQITGKPKVQPTERVDAAHSPVDYVYWMDFLHAPSRTWEEVWWASRWVYMTKDEGVKRFGDVFNNVPIDSEEPVKEWQDNAQKNAARDKKAKVAEIWNKRDGKVCWVAKGYLQALDERDDPLSLEGFFPCPKPLFATMTNGSLIPVPDYCEYEDQAAELDSITNRISNLVRACKAVGVFNSEFKELARLLNEGIDNKLFPVTAWAAFSEKGGMKGAVDMLDITTVIAALQQLYIARDACKQTIYETMGLSDILRGASAASETLGAQKLKAQFGSLRLKNSQGDVARFATDIFRLKAQLICKFYPPEVIVEMSGVMNTADGQDTELLQKAVAMLKDSTVRDFRITIEADTLAQIDEAAEKEEATEIAKSIAGFFKEALPVVQQEPEMLPVVSEVLLFTLRRFKAGRQLEATIERTMRALEEKAKTAAAQPKQPDPEIVKAQMQQQMEQQRLQHESAAEAQRTAHEQQLAQAEEQRLQAVEMAKHQREQAELQAKAALEQQRMEFEARDGAAERAEKYAFERWKVERETDRAIAVAEVSAQASMQNAAVAADAKANADFGADNEGATPAPKRKKPMDTVKEMHAGLKDDFQKSHDQLHKMVTDISAEINKPKPRMRKVLTLPSGRTATVEEIA